MVLPGDQVRGVGKGKAVNIVHTWKDHLWEIGGKEDPPAPRVIELNQNSGADLNEEDLQGRDPDHTIESTPEILGEGSPKTQDEPHPTMPPRKELNPMSQQGIFSIGRVWQQFTDKGNPEVSQILLAALLQSISTVLSKLPPSSFPISPSIFYDTYILPHRPFQQVSATSTPIDIKHSAHKSLTAFLKANAKEGLIKLKESKGEVTVTGMCCIDKIQVCSHSDSSQASIHLIPALMGTSST